MPQPLQDVPLEVLLRWDQAPPDWFSGKRVVIIDVIRASTTICHALWAGARLVKPYQEIEACRKMATEGYLIAGERQGAPLQGFHLSNSPEEFTAERVKGKQIALTTTNGTYAVARARQASEQWVGCFSNFEVLARALVASPYPTVLLCAGWQRSPVLEDTLFAGALLHRLAGSYYSLHGDQSWLALSAWRGRPPSLLQLLRRSVSAPHIFRNGLKADVRFCLQWNTLPVVPVALPEQSCFVRLSELSS